MTLAAIPPPKKSKRRQDHRPPTVPLLYSGQTKDNLRFAQQEATPDSAEVLVFQAPGISFPDWTATTGARSVSALMSFAFLACLLSASSSTSSTLAKDSANCFDSVYLQYLAHDLALHVACMSRLYNDWGSLETA
ncbi:hypothetical protein MMC13_008481 [Lambiella insularis]|nr:hypothetical protein [Lambiella insularis]